MCNVISRLQKTTPRISWNIAEFCIPQSGPLLSSHLRRSALMLPLPSAVTAPRPPPLDAHASQLAASCPRPYIASRSSTVIFDPCHVLMTRKQRGGKVDQIVLLELPSPLAPAQSGMPHDWHSRPSSSTNTTFFHFDFWIGQAARKPSQQRFAAYYFLVPPGGTSIPFSLRSVELWAYGILVAGITPTFWGVPSEGPMAPGSCISAVPLRVGKT